MNHLVIVAHPRAESFNMQVMRTYTDELRQRGHQVVERDLYRIGFNPVLTEADFLAIERGMPPADVIDEQELIKAADVLTFISPLWWRSMPAMMKGYFDRVFSHDFAYELVKGEFRGLLADKKAVLFTSLASTPEELAVSHADRAFDIVQDLAIITTCGMDIIEHVHFAPVAPGRTTRLMVEQWLLNVRELVRRHF